MVIGVIPLTNLKHHHSYSQLGTTIISSGIRYLKPWTLVCDNFWSIKLLHISVFRSFSNNNSAFFRLCSNSADLSAWQLKTCLTLMYQKIFRVMSFSRRFRIRNLSSASTRSLSSLSDTSYKYYSF